MRTDKVEEAEDPGCQRAAMEFGRAGIEQRGVSLNLVRRVDGRVGCFSVGEGGGEGGSRLEDDGG